MRIEFGFERPSEYDEGEIRRWFFDLYHGPHLSWLTILGLTAYYYSGPDDYDGDGYGYA